MVNKAEAGDWPQCDFKVLILFHLPKVPEVPKEKFQALWELKGKWVCLEIQQEEALEMNVKGCLRF